MNIVVIARGNVGQGLAALGRVISAALGQVTGLAGLLVAAVNACVPVFCRFAVRGGL